MTSLKVWQLQNTHEVCDRLDYIQKIGIEWQRFHTLTNCMIQISMFSVKQKVLECLDKAALRISSEGLTHATSLGLWIDGRFGKCGVALNEDDDNTFRCSEIASFTIRHIFGVWIEEIGDMDERLHDSEAGGLGQILPSIEGAPQVQFHTSEEFSSYLGPEAVSWLQEWAGSSKWSPCWYRVEVTNSGFSETWRVDERPLPVAGNWDHEPVPVKGISTPSGGLKVYELAYGPRKYASISQDYSRNNPRFDGTPLLDTIQLPLTLAKTWSQWLRVGGLARFSRDSVFGLRAYHPSTQAVRDFLGSEVEFVPANDGSTDWLLVNVLNKVYVLDQSASKLRRSGSDILSLEVAEFCPDLLRQVRSPLFRLAEYANYKIYFLERPGEESFLQFCERIGLRGLEWNLVWCEDISGIEAALQMFVQKIEARLKRIEGTAEVSKYLQYECISGIQCDIWRITRFRDLFNAHGIDKALRQVQGLGSLAIPVVRSLLDGQWWYRNEPKQKDIKSSLTKALNRRDLLLDMRGYMCSYLPNAIASLNSMEKFNTGLRAVFGPEV